MLLLLKAPHLGGRFSFHIFFPRILSWFIAFKGFPRMSYRQDKPTAESKLDSLVLKMSFG